MSDSSRYSPSDYTIACTMPDQLLRHDISDEELDMLCEAKRDNVWEGMWVSVGLLVGALPAALAALLQYDPTKPMKLVDLTQIVLLFVALALSVVLWLVVSKRQKNVVPKQDEIRKRTLRKTQQGGGDNA